MRMSFPSPTPAPALALNSAMLEHARPAAAYLAGLGSAASRNAMESRLQYAARLLGADAWQTVPWSRLNAAQVQAMLANSSDGAPATRNLMLAALRGVARAAWRMGVMDSDTYARIRDVQKVNGSRLPTGRYVDPLERAKLIGSAREIEGTSSSAAAAARDTAALALAMGTGMRREEICRLKLDDITERGADMFVLRVNGKRNKQREIFVQNGALRALRAWLDLRGDAPGCLVCRVLKGGHVQSELFLSPAALHKRLQSITERADLEGATGWHDFRRSVISDMLEQGTDIAVVAQLVGHADVRTTAAYDRRPRSARAAAAAKVSVPY